MSETGWRPLVDFDDGLQLTVTWYRENGPWYERVKSGAYRDYYERQLRAPRRRAAPGALGTGAAALIGWRGFDVSAAPGQAPSGSCKGFEGDNG